MSTQALSESITPEVYFQIEALSYSGMKSLAVSPLRFWYDYLNPNRPEERESPALKFGSALHCAVLEPKEFDKRYCRDFSPADVEGALVTMDDLREWCKSKGLTVSAKRKDELIARVLDHDPNAPVYDVIRMQWEEKNSGKVALNEDEFKRVTLAADALRSEIVVRAILSEGEAEKSYFAVDPETKAPLKGRLDWVNGSVTADFKTFTATRGKSIDRCVNDAILYEKYHWQAVHNTTLRALNGESKKRYILIFVESEEPFEVRVRELKPIHGETNFYWERARVETRNLIETYARYSKQFGRAPWRESADVEVLLDAHLPGIAYA